MTPNKIYLVCYYGGSYEDGYTRVIFATTKKSTATKYVTKFNSILKKWKDYYNSQFCDYDWASERLKGDLVETKFDRWYSLGRITACYYDEIQIR